VWAAARSLMMARWRCSATRMAFFMRYTLCMRSTAPISCSSWPMVRMVSLCITASTSSCARQRMSTQTPVWSVCLRIRAAGLVFLAVVAGTARRTRISRITPHAPVTKVWSASTSWSPVVAYSSAGPSVSSAAQSRCANTGEHARAPGDHAGRTGPRQGAGEEETRRRWTAG
jgi:hypothetical protein